MRIFGNLLKDFNNNEFNDNVSDIKIRASVIENKFIFSYIWSLGGSLRTDYRKPFDIFTKKLTNGDIPLPTNV